MVDLSWLGAAVLGAVANRLRGGVVAVPGGTQIGRAAWGAAVALVMWWSGLSWPLWAAGGFLAFLGAMTGQAAPLSVLPPSWTSWAPAWAYFWLFDRRAAFSMGHTPDTPAGWWAWYYMTCWGLLRIAGPAAVLWWAGSHGWWLAVLSGLLCAPVYEAVWHVPVRWLLPYLGRTPDPRVGDFPQLAEGVLGALMMMATYGGWIWAH